MSDRCDHLLFIQKRKVLVNDIFLAPSPSLHPAAVWEGNTGALEAGGGGILERRGQPIPIRVKASSTVGGGGREWGLASRGLQSPV